MFKCRVSPLLLFFSLSVFLVGCDVHFVVRLWFYVNEEELDPAGMASEVIVRSYALGSFVLCFPSLSLPFLLALVSLALFSAE